MENHTLPPLVYRSNNSQGPSDPWVHRAPKPKFNTIAQDFAPDVPTVRVRPPSTPRSVLYRRARLNIVTPNITPSQDMAMCELNKSKLDLITTVVSRTSRNIPVRLLPLPNIKGLVSRDTFEKLLDLYDNNQAYLIQENNERGLLLLEEWFICIIEQPLDRATKDRERSKRTRWTSYYCNPTVTPIVTKQEIRDYVTNQHTLLAI